MFVQISESKFINLNLVAQVEHKVRGEEITLTLSSDDNLIFGTVSNVGTQQKYFSIVEKALHKYGLLGTLGGETRGVDLSALVM